jgi:hypothetical protein
MPCASQVSRGGANPIQPLATQRFRDPGVKSRAPDQNLNSARLRSKAHHQRDLLLKLRVALYKCPDRVE